MLSKTEPHKRVSQPNGQMLRRTLFLMAVCGVFAFALLLCRLYKLQIIDHEFYRARALEQQMRELHASSERGGIYDRNMVPLALSQSADSIYLSPAEIEAEGEDRELIARGLSEILSVPYEEIYRKSGDTSSYYVSACKKTDRKTADAVRKFKTDNSLSGIRIEPDMKRVYPNRSLACHVLGFTGDDNQGLEGLEAGYDYALRGSSGRTMRLTNARGTDLLFSQFEDQRPGREGLSLVLSLDSGIQYFTEKHLKQAVKDYDIRNGAGAIVMDVNTGGILAMASEESYDPNDFLKVGPETQRRLNSTPDSDLRRKILREAQLKQWRNKALCDSYEPGSTFKIITLAMALEEGTATMDSRYYCSGSVNVRGRTNPIHCWKDGGHGSQTLTQAVQHSCNAAFVNIGLQIGAERFYDYLEAFGFLEKTGNRDENLSGRTGIDLNGETGSIFWSENVFCSERNLSQLAAASFGQTFTISPLQLITAVSACVNGGHLMKPYIVQSMLNPDGSTACTREPEELRQVISRQTSDQVCSILESVVGDPRDGTGRNAAVAGYRIGGKTGTSEKVSLEAATGKKEYIVSFIGFAPADDPEIAVLVFLDTPGDRSGVYISGGQMAAPVVGKMFADILPYMGIAPGASAASGESLVPAAEGMSLEAAGKLADSAGLKYSVRGGGDRVTAQLPSGGSVIAGGSEIVFFTDGPVPERRNVLPDLQGVSYTAARDRLEKSGIYIHSLSPVTDPERQLICGQSLPEGTLLPGGSVVELMLIDGDEQMLGKY